MQPAPGDVNVVDLPVHSSADIHLSDAFGAQGCPLCRERARTEAAYLEAILVESVNDISFRQGLDAARGFCPVHARGVLDTDRRRAGSLGAAILLRATLVVRLKELEAAHDVRCRARAKRIDGASRPPACPVCARLDRTEAGLVDSLMRLTEEPAWAEAVADAPLCLEHLVALFAQRPASSTWPGIEGRQLDRLCLLRDELEAYAHASSHDRRHTLTDTQRASVDAAAGLLGDWRAPPGDVARGPRR